MCCCENQDFINDNILGFKFTSTWDFFSFLFFNEEKQVLKRNRKALYSWKDIYSSRVDNWKVDTGSDPVEHNGLSDFGKVSMWRINTICFPHSYCGTLFIFLSVYLIALFLLFISTHYFLFYVFSFNFFQLSSDILLPLASDCHWFQQQ